MVRPAEVAAMHDPGRRSRPTAGLHERAAGSPRAGRAVGSRRATSRRIRSGTRPPPRDAKARYPLIDGGFR